MKFYNVFKYQSAPIRLNKKIIALTTYAKDVVLNEDRSKCSWVMSSEPFSTLVSVVPNNYNHFIEDGPHLDAARKSTVRRLGIIASK